MTRYNPFSKENEIGSYDRKCAVGMLYPEFPSETLHRRKIIEFFHPTVDLDGKSVAVEDIPSDRLFAIAKRLHENSVEAYKILRSQVKFGKIEQNALKALKEYYIHGMNSNKDKLWTTLENASDKQIHPAVKDIADVIFPVDLNFNPPFR